MTKAPVITVGVFAINTALLALATLGNATQAGLAALVVAKVVEVKKLAKRTNPIGAALPKVTKASKAVFMEKTLTIMTVVLVTLASGYLR